MRRIRLPGHLRGISGDYDIEGWVDGTCPLEEYFEYVHPMAVKLDGKEFDDPGRRDGIIINVIAQLIDEDGALEDYCFANRIATHDLNQEGAMRGPTEAAAVSSFAGTERDARLAPREPAADNPEEHTDG